MPKLNWIDALFFGVRRILAGGVEMPERPAINFVGATVVDNPAENRLDVVLGASGLRKISPIVMSDYTASPGELVRVDANSPVVITLPTARRNPLAEVDVKEVSGGTKPITVVATLGERVDQQETVQILGPHCRTRLVSDGAGWAAM